MKEKLFLVTRSDLEVGVRASQLCHAIREFREVHPEVDRQWYVSSNTIVLLETRDLGSLSALAERAAAEGIPVVRFEEPDLGNVLTALAIAPSGRKLVRSLPLAFKDPSPSWLRHGDSNLHIAGSTPAGSSNT